MSNPQLLSVALIQHACVESTADNQLLISELITEAAENGAQLVVLQELHNTRYFCQHEHVDNFDLAEPIPGPSTQWLGQLAASLKVVIVGSLFEKRTTGLYHNTAVVLESDGSLAGTYRKMHIPEDPGYHEKFYFTPGDAPSFAPIKTSLGQLGVMVCWDQWYPEAARLMTLAGAEILIYPTAIGWDTSDSLEEQQRQLDAWVTVQRGHAIANGIPVLACNRVGKEPTPNHTSQQVPFWGNSFAVGPQGEVLAQAGSETSILYCEINQQRTEDVRRIWPFLRDRRIDAYQNINKRLID